MVQSRSRKDCAIVALANAFDLSYDCAWQYLEPAILSQDGECNTNLLVEILGDLRLPKITSLHEINVRRGLIHVRNEDYGHLLPVINGLVRGEGDWKHDDYVLGYIYWLGMTYPGWYLTHAWGR